MYQEGWRRATINLNDHQAHIDIDIQVNSTVTIRCPMEVVRSTLDVVELFAFKQSTVSKHSRGARIFSCPVDGLALEAYCEEIQRGGVVV